MKKILITGIEGFVGNYLANYLIRRNYEVFGLHLLPVAQPLPQVKYFSGNVLDYPELKRVIAEIQPEGIFHLAAISSVAYSFLHPEETIQTNFQGTYNLLRALLELALFPRVIFISSADVYGKVRKKRPIKEDAPLNPVSPYGISKQLAEECALLFQKKKGLDVVILRPFNHIGVGQREDFVFPYCAKRIAEMEQGIGEEYLALGNIDVQRDYLDVRDVVRAYEMAFRLGKSGEVYNVATGKPIKIREGVEFLISLAKRPIKIKIKKERKRRSDIPYLSGDPRKFQKVTGWQPEREIKETLKELLDYYRKRI